LSRQGIEEAEGHRSWIVSEGAQKGNLAAHLIVAAGGIG
jgi:hypothetical protein